jgi:hypothetical protein
MAMDEGAYIESFLQNNPMSTKSDEDFRAASGAD